MTNDHTVLSLLPLTRYPSTPPPSPSTFQNLKFKLETSFYHLRSFSSIDLISRLFIGGKAERKRAESNNITERENFRNVKAKVSNVQVELFIHKLSFFLPFFPVFKGKFCLCLLFYTWHFQVSSGFFSRRFFTAKFLP